MDEMMSEWEEGNAEGSGMGSFVFVFVFVFVSTDGVTKGNR